MVTLLSGGTFNERWYIKVRPPLMAYKRARAHTHTNIAHMYVCMVLSLSTYIGLYYIACTSGYPIHSEPGVDWHTVDRVCIRAIIA